MKQFNSLLTPFLIVICALFSLLFSSCEEGECDESIPVKYNVTYDGREIHINGFENLAIPQEGGTVIYTPDVGFPGMLSESHIFIGYGTYVWEHAGSLYSVVRQLDYESKGEWGTLKVTWDRNGSWEHRVREATKMVLTLTPNTSADNRLVFVGMVGIPVEGGLTITQPGLGDSD